MKERKKNPYSAGLAKVRMSILAVLLSLVSLVPSECIAAVAPADDADVSVEMYQRSDSAELQDSYFDSMDAGGTGLDGCMTDVMVSFLDSYDTFLVAVFRHYLRYVLLFWIVIFVVQAVGFLLVAHLASRSGRNVVTWCILSALATPLLSIVILLFIGKIKDGEPRHVV